MDFTFFVLFALLEVLQKLAIIGGGFALVVMASRGRRSSCGGCTPSGRP